MYVIKSKTKIIIHKFASLKLDDSTLHPIKLDTKFRKSTVCLKISWLVEDSEILKSLETTDNIFPGNLTAHFRLCSTTANHLIQLDLIQIIESN